VHGGAGGYASTQARTRERRNKFKKGSHMAPTFDYVEYNI